MAYSPVVERVRECSRIFTGEYPTLFDIEKQFSNKNPKYFLANLIVFMTQVFFSVRVLWCFSHCLEAILDGFVGEYLRRTNAFCDGCAIFYLPRLFALRKYVPVHYNLGVTNMDRDNVGGCTIFFLSSKWGFLLLCRTINGVGCGWLEHDNLRVQHAFVI